MLPSSSGGVLAAHRVEHAVRTPGPVADDRIDEAGDKDGVNDVAPEAGTTDHGA